MPEMFCCNSRMRIDRNGVALVFYERDLDPHSLLAWQAYQIYESDRWVCPECKRCVHTGLGQRPIIVRCEGEELFEAYLEDLMEERLVDMIGRAQPWVAVYE
jgi:hypothetical protein